MAILVDTGAIETTLVMEDFLRSQVLDKSLQNVKDDSFSGCIRSSILDTSHGVSRILEHDFDSILCKLDLLYSVALIKKAPFCVFKDIMNRE